MYTKYKYDRLVTICQQGLLRDTYAMHATPPGSQDVSVHEGRRARKARLTRRALLDAGLAAFERQPPALVSVLDLTEAADVAKGVFYLHFASKDDFLLALAEDVQHGFLMLVIEGLQAQPHATLHDRVEIVIRQYAKAAVEMRKSVCFAMRMASFVGEEIGPPGELASKRAAYLQRLATAIDDAGVDGPAHPMTHALAKRVDAFCWGLIWQALQLNQPPPSPDELASTILPAVETLLIDISSQMPAAREQ